MRSARVVPIVTLVAALSAAAVAVGARDDDGFPHEEHAGLFPLCIGCHEGIPQEDPATMYPAPESCTGCHDGVEVQRVEWDGPGEHGPGNLDFSHPMHAEELAEHAEELAERGEEAPECQTCHAPEGAGRMVVEGIVVGQCLACHEHQAEAHYADANCSTCHLRLASTDFDRTRIDELPYPDDHADGGFLRTLHGEGSEASIDRCAVCHTRERCTSCHVDASGVAAIQNMPAAPAAMTLPDYPAHYFTPDSHLGAAWLEGHGTAAAASGANCSTCHKREGCESCHVGASAGRVAELPAPPARTVALPMNGATASRPQQAPGVGLERRAPDSHFTPFFEREHGTVAAADDANCTTCHTRQTCESCHNAPAGPVFHPDNFAARHPTAAYSPRMECSNCHDRRVFCRDCHTQAGMQAVGRLDFNFHDGQPVWLLRHGQAARQGLETCTTCHTQRDCLQCHSTLGAFQVNPHGPGLDLERVHDRNQQICLVCHVDDPIP